MMGKANKALLSYLLLTFCCVAKFLKDLRLVHSPDVGDPCFKTTIRLLTFLAIGGGISRNSCSVKILLLYL